MSRLADRAYSVKDGRAPLPEWAEAVVAFCEESAAALSAEGLDGVMLWQLLELQGPLSSTLWLMDDGHLSPDQIGRLASMPAAHRFFAEVRDAALAHPCCPDGADVLAVLSDP